MNKIRLGVIFGGQSSEYSVSLHSAGSFLRALHTDKYDVYPIGISKTGQFRLCKGTIEQIEHDTWLADATPIAWIHGGFLDLSTQESVKLDVVFPILHGKNGEDGSIQGMMNVLDLPCVGCDVLGSAICMDKEIMHLLIDEAGLQAADYVCLHENEPIPSYDAMQKKIPGAWVIKPCNAGSSYGVHFVDSEEKYLPALKDAFKYDGRGKVLVEKAIDGFEIGCAVMEEDGKMITGELDEIETAHEIFDFSGKYAMAESAIYCPARLSKEQSEQAKQQAKQYFRALQCRDMARVDMFVCKDGSIVLNEINTIPGFTDTSRYPTMMKEAGRPFPELIDALIAQALKKEHTV